MTTAGELGLAPKHCICDPMDLAALGHMTNCPCYQVGVKWPLSKCCALCEAEEVYRQNPTPPSTDPEFATKSAAKREYWEKNRRVMPLIDPTTGEPYGDEK